MAQKDIYKIDNYFISIGWIMLVIGGLSMAVDPFLWNEISITESKGETGSSTYFESKNGRTLEEIQLEKGEGFIVEERSLPIVRLALAANGLILLIIGYTYRSREKKIISVWNAIEHMGEARVADLSVMHGLPREFIIKHIKDINAQHHAVYSYDARHDKIVNSKLLTEFVVLVDCENCGNKINEKVSLSLTNPPRCQYCGTGVSVDELNKLKQEVMRSMQFIPVSTGKSEFNVGVFILLLIIFWPGAIAYVIIKKSANSAALANLQSSLQALGTQSNRQQ
jgi:DNA-directed RNA polymerase subunit RPC12/RpoP